VERCCKCTVTSTCITSRCCCKNSNRFCTNCACFVKCLNLRPPDGDPPDLDQFIHEVETGLNLNDAASASDEKLFQAYEHILHQNSGYQLDGGIEDSGEWVFISV
jgi:hypothetical protein